MERQLIDGGPVWFDRETADKFGEDSFFDGRNHISSATGSQWDHEELWLTAKGSWILHRWSQWQGSIDSWGSLAPGDAASWLIRNKHEDHPICAELLAKSEK